MSHYYINDQSLPENTFEIPYSFGGHSFRFVSQAGVFAKDKVDENSHLLLRVLPPLSGRLCDLGCGYGLLGVALGKVYGLDVLCVDVNPRAVDLARRNLEAHGVNGRAVTSDGLAETEGLFDNIVLNPPIHAGKQTVFRLYEEAREHLYPGGCLYVVILKKHGAESSRKKIAEVFGTCEEIYGKKGAFVFKGVNRAQFSTVS